MIISPPRALGPETQPRLRPHHSATTELDAQTEMRALEALRASFEGHFEFSDDADLMLALAEGQTNLLELIDAILGADFDDEALLAGLKQAKETLAARFTRIETRRQSRRALVEQALMLVERKTLERPLATLTLTDRPPALIVEQEAEIPARFFTLKPSLNRRDLKAALDQGEAIPGARLSNGSTTLTIRRR